MTNTPQLTTQRRQHYKVLTAVFVFCTALLNAQVADSILIKAAPQFSGQIAVVKNDSLIFSYSRGWANFPLQIPLTNQHLLEIGELSSFFTRDAIERLVADKKLTLDSAVALYLPQFPYPSITVRQLMNHTSGLPSNYLKLYHRNIYDDENIKLKDKAKNINNADILSILNKSKPALEFTPGEKSVPCNTNDIVLAYLIEVLSMRSYDDCINTSLSAVFQSKIVANNDIEYTPMPSRAWGHRKTDFATLTVEESLKDLGFRYEDATTGHHHIYANAENLAKYFAGKQLRFDKYPMSYFGHEPGYNATLRFYKEYVIVILMNTNDDSDAALMLKEIEKGAK